MQLQLQISKKSETSPHTKFSSNLYSYLLFISDSGETLVSSNWPTDPAVPAFNDAQTLELSTSQTSSPSFQQELYSPPANDQKFQFDWTSSTSYPVNHDVQSQPFTYNFLTGFDEDKQQYFYCSNWEYSPPFYPSTTDKMRLRRDNKLLALNGKYVKRHYFCFVVTIFN